MYPIDPPKSNFFNTPQSSIFFEQFCKQVQSVVVEQTVKKEEMPYLSVISDLRWQPLGSETPSKATTIVDHLKVTATSPLNIDLESDSNRHEFNSNGVTVDLRTPGSSGLYSSIFKGWTPWTPTVFGPSLIGVSTSRKLQNDYSYSTLNQEHSFNSLPPRINSLLVNNEYNYGSTTQTSPSVLSGASSPIGPPDPLNQIISLPPLHTGQFCQFCKNNGKPERLYKNHILKTQDGKVVCPFLRAYNCPLCNNGGGDNAHTLRYCRLNRPQIWRQL